MESSYERFLHTECQKRDIQPSNDARVWHQEMINQSARVGFHKAQRAAFSQAVWTRVAARMKARMSN